MIVVLLLFFGLLVLLLLIIQLNNIINLRIHANEKEFNFNYYYKHHSSFPTNEWLKHIRS